MPSRPRPGLLGEKRDGKEVLMTRARGGRMSVAVVGGNRTTAVEASPTTASAGPAATLTGASTAMVGTNGVPTGAGRVLAGSRAASTMTGGARPAGGADLKEEEAVRREREAHVAEKTGTSQVAMFDHEAVQQELLTEG